MVDRGLAERLRPLADAIRPPARVTHERATRAAIAEDGSVEPGALSVAVYIPVAWYLTGTLTNGTNVNAEIVIPTNALLRSLRARVKTPPSGGECTIALTIDNVVVGSVSVSNGESGGVSNLSVPVSAGSIARLNVTAANSAANATITLAFSPAS